MISYTLRRLWQLIPVVVLASATVFVLMRLVPGDPAQMVAGPEASSQSIAEVRARLGLDQPLPATVTRNLFETRLEFFPVDGSRPQANNRTPTDPTFWERLAKSQGLMLVRICWLLPGRPRPANDLQSNGAGGMRTNFPSQNVVLISCYASSR